MTNFTRQKCKNRTSPNKRSIDPSARDESSIQEKFGNSTGFLFFLSPGPFGAGSVAEFGFLFFFFRPSFHQLRINHPSANGQAKKETKEMARSFSSSFGTEVKTHTQTRLGSLR